jgi:hypothetical protein
MPRWNEKTEDLALALWGCAVILGVGIALAIALVGLSLLALSSI